MSADEKSHLMYPRGTCFKQARAVKKMRPFDGLLQRN